MNTNTEREELIELLDKERWKPMAADPTDDFSCGIIEQSNPSVADAIIAAGYRKPRTITTAEELDALPIGSTVRSDTVYLKVLSMRRRPVWGCVGSSEIIPPADILDGGEVQVIDTPEPKR